MMYPSVDEFKEILFSKSLSQVVREYVFEGEPFVFRDRPKALALLREHLGTSVSVSEENIIVIGSGKIGFSLSPHNFGRRFSEYSDIDVVVVDEALFDKVWTTILGWNYPRSGPRPGRLSGRDNLWAGQRKEELYWGWFRPDKIRYDGLSMPSALKPLVGISTCWFNAFQGLSRHPEFADRHVSGRLYRTWNHARLYHVDGLRQIKDFIR